MYHVTEDGPRICKAKEKRCPYGQSENNHFEKQEAAQVQYETDMEKRYGKMGVSVARRVDQKRLQKKYRKLDEK